MSIAKANNVCLNCLTPGHFLKDCKSSYRCKRCQKSHHTLLHTETREDDMHAGNSVSQMSVVEAPPMPVSTHAAMGIKSDILLMTCHVLVESPNGSSMKAQALLDSACFLRIRKTRPEFGSSTLHSKRTDLLCGWSCTKHFCSIYCKPQCLSNSSSKREDRCHGHRCSTCYM